MRATWCRLLYRLDGTNVFIKGLGHIAKRADDKSLSGGLRVRHWKEGEGSDAVDEPRGRRPPHLPLPHTCTCCRRPAAAAAASGIEDDVLSAERLVRARLGVVGGGVEGLGHVAVGFGLPGQQLAATGLQQPEQLGPGRLLEGAVQEEETAVEERRELAAAKYVGIA